ncbi:hypothetical protein [Streptomyces phaeoluteigriseus]
MCRAPAWWCWSENPIRTLRYHGVVEARYRKFLVHDIEALRQFAAGV